jgi:glycosyltransferase involved in cell wall biosynthesis
MLSEMRVADVMYVYDEKIQTAEQQLEQHYTTVGWAEALVRKGVEVIVIKRFHYDASFEINGVQYHFVKDNFNSNLRAWQIPHKLFKKILTLQPDVVHLHEFSRSIQTMFLRIILKKKAAIVIQHHGGSNPLGVKKRFHDFLNRIADGYFFTTIEQGKMWFTSKRLRRKILPVMEGATFFDFESRDKNKQFKCCEKSEARKRTGMSGGHVFLWVGRLDSNKDPLTVLDGFEALAFRQQGSFLYLIYNEEKILNAVKKKVESSPILKKNVSLIGKIPHANIADYYKSADYFVLGSHYEGSGYALSEALRCGCIPIVTDIPSFQMMTNNGRLGALWNPGDAESFYEAAKAVLKKSGKDEAEMGSRFFQNNLSFDAIARTAVQHYQQMMKRRVKL